MLIDASSEVLLVRSDGEELGRVLKHTLRDTVRWRQVGSEEFVWRSSPVSEIASTWGAYVVRESRLQLVRWVSPDWDDVYLPVAASRRDGDGTNVRFHPDGTITYQGTGSMEGKTYDFQWDGNTLTFRGELRQ